ncbi:xanthine permease XanP [Halioglobus japonicus]|uniref:Purine permease n=1 Tax=Halioglobus japonicus TaxID=930805 RepID=A0AAP8MDA7_9GAMM|nr:nucleobase:cation symporter-2 family protein [Halioglobus japonicus]AQA17719.1 xanthine permease XanP [Halioglobus japonicus]PLW85671.1 purine permease [Halioglobus japonicus]GHD16858.1 xanthine permease [Halioglobus japonicus]
MTAPLSSELIYRLDDKPPVPEASFAALQHLLASFVGVVTPTLIIGNILGLQEEVPYLISMALLASGIGTFIQAYRPLGIGAGMLCIQGTSFAFLGAILSAGFMVKDRGGSSADILALITGMCFVGAFIQIGLSQIIPYLRRIVTPLVTGIVITSIGISLIKVGMTDLAGGANAEDFGAPINLGLGFFVIIVIVALNASSNNWVRLSSVILGLLAGLVAALVLGELALQDLGMSAEIAVPQPFKYGFSFELAAFIPLAVIYIISSVETTGDLTANCVISNQPIEGEGYIRRIRNGVLGDGVNSMIAAVLNSFPNTTFSQNTGVIQLTGIASRYVGMYVAGILVVLGLFQGVGDFLLSIPKPVLGGATLVMFGTVAVAGIKILATEELDRRKVIIIAVSFGLGLGLALVPEVFAQTPLLFQNIFSSAAATAGLTAITLSLIIPENVGAVIEVEV